MDFQNELGEEDEDDIAQILQESNDAKEKNAEKQAVVEKEMGESDNTGWWNLVWWRDHFAECNIKRIAHVSGMPDREDELLKQVVSVADTMMKLF